MCVCVWMRVGGAGGGSLFYDQILVLLFYFCNPLAEEERAGCFTIIVFLLSCGG